jgi:hypothetical protein
MPKEKVTRALAQRLAKAKDTPVSGVVFAAVDSDKLTLSSFAARAAQRDQQIRERLGTIMSRIQEWEGRSGRQATIAVRPTDAAVAVTAPPELFRLLADDEAVAALDVEGK